MSLPYDYYPAVLFALNLFSQGETLSKACDDANITYSTFKRYVDTNPELQEMYVEAERRSSDAMADALVNIDNHKLHGQSNPQMAKVISDNIKWLLGKRKPKEYGDRVQVDHSVTVDVAITTALDAARRRVAVEDKSDVIDAVPVYTPEEEAIMAELLG